MARPREFDDEAVLEQALTTFWSKGYDATSMEDLVQSTGLGRASLYGAFGDKEQLFSRVLDHYLTKVTELEAKASTLADARTELETLTSAWVNGACPRQGPRGCFLSMAGTSGTSAEFVRQTLLRAVTSRQNALEQLIARGQASGDLRNPKDPLELARFLIVVQQGIATSARAGMSRKDLAAAMKVALDHVIGECA